MAVEPSHFTLTENHGFMPTAFAQSHWGADHLSGPALVGLAGWVLEHHCGSTDFMPARLTVDLFRAARGAPTTTTVCVLRDGRRIRSAECDVLQGGVAVAHAELIQYRRSAALPGRQWIAPMSFGAPPALDGEILSYVGSDDGGWSRSPARHQNDSRKRFCNRGIKVLANEENTPSVRAAMAAEETSLVTNLGTRGMGYINGDVTVGLSRLPLGDWIGVQADSHWASDGVAVGTATLFDESGAFGSGMTTAISNPAAQIDFTHDPFPLRSP
ncbi:acyl-CoA thioesterase domain-containing protein [Mycobacterium sp.]|uniref:acyl-CoA thioesterase domain-containing protein n=1 Tax=Mycobacterium sp. TaxID=1785 RepID=UPI002B78402A|nr:acyl-CoA thioesterase domain-containing protein [Mycobacterium sp.]HME50033.1 acyl-CoA thioesterase domain-containing protein [Mycobacterium sp.]